MDGNGLPGEEANEDGLNEEQTLSLASAKSGMDEKTARKSGPLPFGEAAERGEQEAQLADA